MLATKNKKEYQKQQNNILPKIEDVFPDRDAVQAKFSNPKAVKVIGIDLGEVFTVAACCRTEPGVRNFTTKRKALYQPTLKARYERERRKTRLVYRTESLVPPRKELTFADANGYAEKVIKSHDLLQAFYSRRRLQRLDHDSRKAKRAEFDVAVDSLLRMVNSHVGRKKEDGEDVLFAVGLGKFQTRTNLSSVHGTLAAHMVSKVFVL